MIRSFILTLVLAAWLAWAPRAVAQTPAAQNGTGSGQSQPPADAQKPAAGQQKTVPHSEANPFPEDTSTVPVLPSNSAPVAHEGTNSGADGAAGMARIPLSNVDLDPVRSPDDPVASPGSGQEQNFSSSLAGLDTLLPKPDDDQPETKKKLLVKEPAHREAATEDLSVGGYYLDRKNWKAALSRFQSAMVLDPDNPEVFWGLAEAERHLGDFADARAHYQTVVDYDPESKHGKDARKALKDPEIANAKAAAPGAGVAK